MTWFRHGSIMEQLATIYLMRVIKFYFSVCGVTKSERLLIEVSFISILGNIQNCRAVNTFMTLKRYKWLPNHILSDVLRL